MTRSSRFTIAAAICMVLGLYPMAAVAAPPPKPSESAPRDSDAVRDLMRTGVAEYKKGNLQAARDAFLQAWIIKPHYAIAASLAEVEMALGQYRSTAEHLEYYLSNLPPELGDKRSAAETQLAEARKHLTVLRVTADSPDATIYVDGVAVEQSRELLVDPGPHVLLAERGNVRTRPREVVFVAGQTLDEHLIIQPAESTPAALPPKPLPTPTHAAVQDSEAHAPAFVLIVGGALTLVAVGVGVGYALDSSSARSEADRLSEETARGIDTMVVARNAQCAPLSGAPPAACAALQDNIEHANRSQDIAAGSFIAGGVLAAGTLATYFLWPKKDAGSDHSRLRVAPWIDKRAAGSTVSVAF
jgi:hypothetical protein